MKIKDGKGQWTLLLLISAGVSTWFLYTERIPSPIYIYNKIYDTINSNLALNGPTVVFVLTNDAKLVLQLRVGCAVEAAAKHHETSQIKLLSAAAIQENVISETLRSLAKVEISDITIGDVLSETPLEDWYSKGSYKGGKYEITHLSDALRIAFLWKYGGIYLDTDVWCLKSLAGLKNSIGIESASFINGAVMHFDKAHPLLHDALEEFVLVYDKNVFNVVGPSLITNIIKRKCNLSGEVNVNSVPLHTYGKCYNVNVLPANAFYPIFYSNWLDYFAISNDSFPDSYTFHLWNQLSHDERVTVGSGVLLDKTARDHCPNMYKLMQEEGTF